MLACCVAVAVVWLCVVVAASSSSADRRPPAAPNRIRTIDGLIDHAPLRSPLRKAAGLATTSFHNYTWSNEMK